MATVYKTILSSPFGPTYGGQASALTGTVYDSTNTALTLYDVNGNSLGTTVFNHTEIGTNTGNYQATIYLPINQAGVATYTWTGTPSLAALGTDVVAPIATTLDAAVATLQTAVTDVQTDVDELQTTAAGLATLSAQTTMQTAVTDVQTDVDELQTSVAAMATAAALAAMQTNITEIAGDTDSLLTGQSTMQTAVTDIQTDVDELQTTVSGEATATALATLQTSVTEVAADTDSLLTGQALQATLAGQSTLSSNQGILLTAENAIRAVTDRLNTDYTTARAAKLDNADVPVSSRLAATADPTAVLATILSDVVSIMSSLATDLGDQTTLASAIAAVRATTDQLAFTAGNVHAVQQGFVQLDPMQDWIAGSITRGTTREIFRVLRAWSRGKNDATSDLLTRFFYDYDGITEVFHNTYDSPVGPTVRNLAGTP